MRTVLRDDIVESPFLDAGISTLRVREASPGAKFKKLLVRGAPVDSYVVWLDGVEMISKQCRHPIKQFSLHFNSALPLINKVCDAVVVQPATDGLLISLLDLKSEAPKMSDARSQLQNSSLFVDYVSNVVGWTSKAPCNLIVSRRVVMTGPRKAFVGGAKRQVRMDGDVGVLMVPVDGSGTGRLPFGELFD